MKRITAFVLTVLLICSVVSAFSVSADEYDVNETVKITAVDSKVSKGVYAYTNDSDKTLNVLSEKYNFTSATLLVFDKDGLLIEAGANLQTKAGACQLSVNIPAGGFLVAYTAGSSAPLAKCYTEAMEGAMLYNATMSVIHTIIGELDKAAKTLTICYDKAEKPTDKTVKFLFVGNSATYFNGTPVKFKGLCLAAGLDVDVDYCTEGSAFLSEFADANHARGKKFRNAIKNTKYDYVVFQDASGASYASTETALTTLIPLAEEAGAEALLYMRYSDVSDPNRFLDESQKHHDKYIKLAEKFGVTCSPANDGYVNCFNSYPHINLFADDGSHHSKEGSYLIACAWLYTFMGISPVGNTYTAQLDEDVVKALQQCAADACEGKTTLPEKEDYYTWEHEGKKYTNIALNKPYTTDGQIYTSDKWSDAKADGTPIGKFTDGVYGSPDGADEACGCWKNETVNITVDLGQVSAVKRIATDLYGNAGWGIPMPDGSTVKAYVSENGSDYTEAGVLTAEQKSEDAWAKYDLALVLQNEINARYIKLEYTIGGTFLWLSEIGVYGVENADGETSGADVSEPTPEESASAESTDVSDNTSADEEKGGFPTGLVIGCAATVIAVVAVIAIIGVKKKKE